MYGFIISALYALTIISLMRTITIPAIYRNGLIEPSVKLELPDNTPVQVEITAPDDPEEMDEFVRSMYGKYAEGPSLLDALMRERAAERQRENSYPLRGRPIRYSAPFDSTDEGEWNASTELPPDSMD